MDKIIKYTVVEANSPEELEEMVMIHIGYGYVPQGGIAVYERLGYYQAMVKYETPSLNQILG